MDTLFNSFVYRLALPPGLPGYKPTYAYFCKSRAGLSAIYWVNQAGECHPDDGRRWLNIGDLASYFRKRITHGLLPVAQFIDPLGAFDNAPYRLSDPDGAQSVMLAESVPESTPESTPKSMPIPMLEPALDHVGEVVPGITNADGTPYRYSIQDEINAGIAEDESNRNVQEVEIKPATDFEVNDYATFEEVFRHEIEEVDRLTDEQFDVLCLCSTSDEHNRPGYSISQQARMKPVYKRALKFLIKCGFVRFNALGGAVASEAGQRFYDDHLFDEDE